MIVIYSLAVAVMCAVISLLMYRRRDREYWNKLSNVPGDPELPLVGNAFRLGNKARDTLPAFTAMWERNGKRTFKLSNGFTTTVMLTSPEDIKIILNATPPFDKHADYRFVSALLGDGLITAKRNKWLKQRKLLTPTFHFKILEQYVNTFNDVGRRFVASLEGYADGSPFNVTPVVSKAAMDGLAETAMGLSLDDGGYDSHKYHESSVRVALHMHQRMFSPFKRFDLLFYLTPSGWEQKRDLKYMKYTMNRILSRRKRELSAQIASVMRGTSLADDAIISIGSKQRLAFLDLLLLTRTDEGEPMADELILDEIYTFIFAGHETITSNLSFILLELSRNPQVQEKAYKEQLEILGTGSEVKITSSHLQQMQYLDRVIKETARMYPPAPLIGRTIDRDVTLGDGTELPAGTPLYLLFCLMHHNEDYFPDPSKFDPDRFAPENLSKIHPYSYLPFSAGSRNCIGQRFAVYEMKVFISLVLRHFEILPAKDFEPIITIDITLKSDNGVMVALKKKTVT